RRHTRFSRDWSSDVCSSDLFLGLNGAGKTTIIRILLGMIKPTSGEVYIKGKKLTKGGGLWNHIGYIVEVPYAYPGFTVRENLKRSEERRVGKEGRSRRWTDE